MSEQIWISIISTILAPTILFVLGQIKNGRENIKKMVSDSHELLAKQIKEIRLQSLRLEILFTLKHNPKDAGTILTLYDKYTRLGGNSFITEYINNWKKTQEKGRKK